MAEKTRLRSTTWCGEAAVQASTIHYPGSACRKDGSVPGVFPRRGSRRLTLARQFSWAMRSIEPGIQDSPMCTSEVCAIAPPRMTGYILTKTGRGT